MEPNETIICPACECGHKARYTETSDWCMKCANDYFQTADQEIDLGETFG